MSSAQIIKYEKCEGCGKDISELVYRLGDMVVLSVNNKGITIIAPYCVDCAYEVAEGII